jgi:hypothetical protein
MAFLADEERRLLTRADGTFRVSLYKALLFLEVATAVKSGALYFEEFYRYRSLDDSLIPVDEWKRHRVDYLEHADLAEASDCRGSLAKLVAALDQQFGFRRCKEYEEQGYLIVPDGYINTTLIEDQWDQSCASWSPSNGR